MIVHDGSNMAEVILEVDKVLPLAKDLHWQLEGGMGDCINVVETANGTRRRDVAEDLKHYARLGYIGTLTFIIESPTGDIRDERFKVRQMVFA